jgi:hypothetical protein
LTGSPAVGTIGNMDDPRSRRRRHRWLAAGIASALLLALSRIFDVAWKLLVGWSDPGHPPNWLYVPALRGLRHRQRPDAL